MTKGYLSLLCTEKAKVTCCHVTASRVTLIFITGSLLEVAYDIQYGKEQVKMRKKKREATQNDIKKRKQNDIYKLYLAY